MKKLKLTQAEIDKLVVVERIDVDSTVCGVGFNDSLVSVFVSGRTVWQYDLWVSILKRCYQKNTRCKNEAYKGVTVCDEWLSFANFFGWLNKEVGYRGKPVGMELDKDLIIKGNRVYSPEACSFVPSCVNTLLISCKVARGEWPVGVCFHKNNGWFVARLNCYGVVKHLGNYSTPEDAFAVYKIAKEAHIKVVAIQHKDVLKPAVFESLMGWEINIDD